MNSSTSDDSPMGVVREVNGELVLDDPIAAAFVSAVEKHNCQNTFDLNLDRIAHFKQRLVETNRSAEEFVIVILDVDDVHGGPIADALMPGFDWQSIRDQGEVPFARGLADRDWIQQGLATFDWDAAEKLQDFAGTAVVVVDHGVAEVYSA